MILGRPGCPGPLEMTDSVAHRARGALLRRRGRHRHTGHPLATSTLALWAGPHPRNGTRITTLDVGQRQSTDLGTQGYPRCANGWPNPT